MAYDRRKFIRATGVLASAIAIGAVACDSENKKGDDTDSAEPVDQPSPGKPLEEFGLQLYTLREDFPKDPKGILKQVSSFGYKQVESFEGPKGIFWGMSHTDFKKYMDELGMTIISSHCDINKNFETKAKQAGEIGMKYLICPYIGPQKSMDDYKKFADKFNTCGETCKKNGLRFAYHNHDYTFREMNGQFPQDFLMQNTNSDVDYQMDVYWVVTPGADPIAWLQKYPNRFRLVHVKDRMKNADPKEMEASCDVGTGVVDWSKVLRVARDNGVQYYIVEQERYDNSTPLKSAQANAQYLKKLAV